ncbi:3'-5' exonuclease [Flavisolibacter tropicus]|uniref:3'-5' exonuclease n=1 Tax=Flavisolibacter tropicus TaxID=1492898 RepID=UPI0008369556|nr:3'-5' exonuclease [Flavisolibacter tropicus]
MEQPYYIPQTQNHFLKLTRPIIFFDLETTGTNTSYDRVIEICAIKLLPDGSQVELYQLLNPTVPIAPEASAVHGFTDEMVVDKPTFGDLADELTTFFEGCDLGGYNIKRFDVPMLMQEFHRFKKYPIIYTEVKLVDAMVIYHSKEKRDLSSAVRFYCEREHEDAHSAKADVLATIDILKHQLLRYEDLEPNTSFLHDYLSGGSLVDFSGKFVRDENGEVVFNFGMHRGKLACTELEYLKWMLSGDFPIDTKMVAKKVYMNCVWETEIKMWLQANKILQNEAVASALYTTIKFGRDMFPFATNSEGEKVTVTYLTEPPSAYILSHPDAIKLLLNHLEDILSGNKSHQ